MKCSVCHRVFRSSLVYHRHRCGKTPRRTFTNDPAQEAHNTGKVHNVRRPGNGTETHFEAVNLGNQDTINVSAVCENLHVPSPGDACARETCEDADNQIVTDNPEAAANRIPFPERSLNSPSPSNTNLSDSVFGFFESYEDHTEELFPNLPPLNPSLSELSFGSSKLLDFCTENQMSLAETKQQYDLIARLESVNLAQFRPVTNQFPSPEIFVSYVDRARKHEVQKDGWRYVVINSEYGTNRSGLYRSILNLLLKTLGDAGSLDSIIPFSEKIVDDQRVYSAPWDANAMRDYLDAHRGAGPLVMVDLYSDGTALARSGSQSANTLRVRFSNIKGQTTTWHEAGIAPSVEDSPSKRSVDKRKERLALFQRFLFVALRDMMEASRDGMLFQGKVIWVRLLMIIADHPQEHAFLCLKSADSFADCSICTMKSRIATSQLQPDIPEEVENSKAPLEDDHGTPSNHPDIDHGDVETINDVQHSARREVFEIQVCEQRTEPRNVPKTVFQQLLVAKRRRHRDQTDKLSSQQKRELRDAKKYLSSVSAHEYPPALAAMRGLGTNPFHLYRAIGFDRLHVLDLGLLRQIPDLAFQQFSKSPYNDISKSDLVRTANQRVIDAPRASRLPRKAPFRLNSGEKQAGMSGLIRRELTPFIPYYVMGLSRTVPPDSDRLLQALLHLELVHREISGINKNPSGSERTMQEIQTLQKLCFDAGKCLAEALGVNINTKMHRTMRHIEEQLLNFGCMRKGATDENETMHKHTKSAYQASNRHLYELAQQLLTARVSVCQADDTNGNGTAGILPQIANRLLLTRQPISRVEEREATASLAETHNIAFDAPETSQSSVPMVGEVSEIRPLTESRLCHQSHTQAMKTIVSRHQSPADAEHGIAKESHPSNHASLWVSRKSVRFQAVFQWWRNIRVQQIVYAGANVFREKNRHDSVSYKICGSTYVGIIQALYHLNGQKEVQMSLIRRLKQTSPDADNSTVVTRFGYRRFRYQFNIMSDDVLLDVVPISDFLRTVMLVPDPRTATKRHGLNIRLNDLPDQINEDRRQARFFELVGYKYTSYAGK